MEAKASAPTYGQMTLRTHPAPMSRSTSSPPTAEPTTVRSRSPRRTMWRTPIMAWQAVARPPRAMHIPSRSHVDSATSSTRSDRRSVPASLRLISEGGGTDRPQAAQPAAARVGDAMGDGAVEADALAGPDHRPVERARLRHEAADGGVERGGDGLEGGDGGIELVALELAERAHAHPDLLGHPAQGQAARQPRGADALSEAGRARHGRTLSSSTEKVKWD